MTDKTKEQDVRAELEVEFKYKEPEVPSRRCGNCNFSRVTNAGAVIPGLKCVLLDIRGKQEGFDWFYSQVDACGTCERYQTR